jgi:hypothetical protein
MKGLATSTNGDHERSWFHPLALDQPMGVPICTKFTGEPSKQLMKRSPNFRTMAPRKSGKENEMGDMSNPGDWRRRDSNPNDRSDQPSERAEERAHEVTNPNGPQLVDPNFPSQPPAVEVEEGIEHATTKAPGTG